MYCTTPDGVAVDPCEAWIALGTYDAGSVDFQVENDTPNAYTVGISSDCDGVYFSGCSSSPSSQTFIANGGGGIFTYNITTSGSTGSQDVHVRFSDSPSGNYVIATIHVTIN